MCESIREGRRTLPSSGWTRRVVGGGAPRAGRRFSAEATRTGSVKASASLVVLQMSSWRLGGASCTGDLRMGEWCTGNGRNRELGRWETMAAVFSVFSAETERGGARWTGAGFWRQGGVSVGCLRHPNGREADGLERRQGNRR